MRFPRLGAGHGYAFVEFSRRHGDFAIVSAAALLEGDATGKITRASVTIGGIGHGAGPRAARSRRRSLGQMPAGKLFRDACESCRKLEAIDDMHAPATTVSIWRRCMSRRALEKARARTECATRGRIEGTRMGETRKIALTVNGKRYEDERSRCA